jgi:hypothetical protein
MDLERLITRAIKIQSIPAPTFNESKRALFLKNAFENTVSSPVQATIQSLSLLIWIRYSPRIHP